MPDANELCPDFQLYAVDFEGESSRTELIAIEGACVNAPNAIATDRVNALFADVIAQQPNIGPMFVVRRGVGVVASELIHSWTAETMERRGRQDRQLRWVTDPITTGLG